jgi:hypothetical protein
MIILRDLLVGAVGSAIAYYAIKVIERYLARRTVRGRERAIQQLTQEIQLLERLGVSDRALLLCAFQILCPIIALAAVATAISVAGPWLALIEAPPIVILLASVIGIAAFYAATVFKKLEDPEPNLAKLRQRLRTRRSGGPCDEGRK